ncbi:MAG: tetratricopeptide repeat protein [Caulobacterales bacterium]|nr:tetratricopeptide repeat protein [Caulobacterales bacterium]
MLGAAALAGAMAAAAGTPALGQSVQVLGDPGARECYYAARNGDSSRLALESCDKAIDYGGLRRRDLAGTLINRGILLASRNALDAAMDDYLRARRLRRNLPESYIGEGNVLFRAGDYAGAIDAYDLSLEKGLRARHVAHFNRGLALEQLRMWDDAEEAYLMAAALSPDWGMPPAYLERLEAKRADARSLAARDGADGRAP